MSAAAGVGDPLRLGRGGVGSGVAGRGSGGPASRRVVVAYGFWVYLLSDIILFSAFFAAYAVLRDASDGGPTERDLFDLGSAGLQTAVLLASSFFCGLAGVAIVHRARLWFQAAMVLTLLFGAGFLALEWREFSDLVAQGAGPSRSAFLSAYFALLGCHFLHVALGCFWILVTMAQVATRGVTPRTERRFLCFSLFWHGLDIVWVGVFTIVYLYGAGQWA